MLLAATRLSGTDGVSLEARKVREGLEALGHRVFALAGALDSDWEGAELPEMHFQSPLARRFQARAFGPGPEDPELVLALIRAGRELEERLAAALGGYRPDLLLVENAWAIPLHLPLALALFGLWQRLGVPALSHNHDYFWERRRFLKNRVPSLLARYFPPAGPGQLSINTLEQAELRFRRGLDSHLLPNVMDFDRSPPGLDGYNADFRESLGIGDRLLLLQPTRVVPRKRIEKSLDLAAALRERGFDPVVLVTHAAGDEGYRYQERLRAYARAKGVDLRFAADRVARTRGRAGGRKVYSLWDAYLHADLVTYPSVYEGFGNALLEAVWMRRPVVVGRYPVYLIDIRPKGFRFVEVEDHITPEVVEQVVRLLDDAELRRSVVEHNRELARRHFGYGTLRKVTRAALDEAVARARGAQWPS